MSHSSELYGAQRSLLRLIAKIDLKKYDPFVIFPNRGPLFDQIESLGISSFIVSRPLFIFNEGIRNRLFRLIDGISRYVLKWIIYIIKLTLLLNKQKPDLVYVNTIAYSSPIISAKILRMPVLLHMRESIVYLTMNDLDLVYENFEHLTYAYLNLANILTKLRLFFIIKFTDKFICVSEATKKLLDERNIDPYRIIVIYNGVNVDWFKPSKQFKKRMEMNIDCKELLIGFIGQLVSIKGVDDFIKTAIIIRKKKKNCKFLIVGGSLESDYYKKKILPLLFKNNLRKYIIFTGYVEDVREYLSAIDIFVNTSRIEPFARVNLEAMAMEKPIVATNAGGNPEAILDGKTGYITPVGDPIILAKRVLELINNKDLMEKFGKAGRERVEKNFTIEHYYKGVERVIDQLLLEFHNS